MMEAIIEVFRGLSDEQKDKALEAIANLLRTKVS